MPLQIDSMRHLAGTGNVVLDKQTGTLTAEKGLRLRSFFNIGDARQRNAETLVAIHHAILNSPRYASDEVRNAAAALLGNIDTKRGITASQVKDLFSKLDAINSKEEAERRCTARLLSHRMPQWLRGHEIEIDKAIRSYVLAHASHGNYSGIDIRTHVDEALYLISAEVARAGADADMEDLIFSTLGSAMVKGDGTPITQQEFQRRAAGLRDDLTHINARAQASSDPAAVKALGKEFILALGGPCDPAAFDAMDAYVSGLDLQGISSLKASSSTAEILAALQELGEKIDCSKIPYPAGVTGFNGGNETYLAMKYMVQRAVAELPPAARNNLMAALDSTKGHSAFVFSMRHPAAGQAVGNFFAFAGSYLRNTPVDAYMATMSGASPDEADLTPLVRCMYDPKDAFSGTGVSMFMNMFIKGTGLNTGTALHAKFDESVRRHVCVLVADEMKKFADFEPTLAANLAQHPTSEEMAKAIIPEVTVQFDKDIGRDVEIRMPDGNRLPSDPVGARNGLARLVTGNPNAEFATLSHTDRNKVYSLMGFMHQGLEQSPLIAMSALTGPNGGGLIHIFNNEYSDNTNLRCRQAMQVSNLPGGGLKVHFQMYFPCQAIRYTDETGAMKMLGDPTKDVEGAVMRYEEEIEVPASALDDAARQDWASCDCKDFDSLPQNFRFGIKARGGFHLDIPAETLEMLKKG